MLKNILTLPGDGIGPEIMDCAVRLLKTIETHFSFPIALTTAHIGGASIDADGVPLTIETLLAAQQADAILLGAVGGPQWDHLTGQSRPEYGLLQIRKELGLFQNLRPVVPHPCLAALSPLKATYLDNVDILVVRELTGDVYFGPKGRIQYTDALTAFDLMSYTADEIERIVHCGFKLAMNRRQHLTVVDKANVLETSRLWRDVVAAVQPHYPDVHVTYMYVDNAAMQLILNPRQFDVLLTGNLFGDILSDQASTLSGSIGLMPSASLNQTNKGLYEPIHGSAPDLKGMDKANPIGMLLSVAMMFGHSFDRKDIQSKIEEAVWSTVTCGHGTPDLQSLQTKKVGTYAFTTEVLKQLIAKEVS